MQKSSLFTSMCLGLILTSCQAGSAESQTVASDVNLGAVDFSAKETPNIVFIFTDDLGYHDLSVTGSEIYQTPHIDSLAGDSLQFKQAYASYPRCTPSRYGLLTATYPVKENKGNIGTIPAEQNPIRQFKAANYQTYFVGKWHLGEGVSSAVGYGFDESYAAGATGGAHSHHYPFNKQGAPVKGEKSPIPDVEKDGKPGDFLTDVMTTQAIKYMKDASAAPDKPFMVMLSYYAVHTPLQAKKADIDRNKAEIKAYDFGDTPEFISEGVGRRKMRQNHPAYAGLVENVDENVGRVLKSLNEMGIADNTIVVFSSDHGGLSNDGDGRERDLATTNTPLKAGKGHLYEGGIRVPLFIRWPGAIKPRVNDDSIVLGMDLFPTLLDLVADGTVQGIDGQSAEKVITGEESWRDRTVFWHSAKARPYSTGDSPSSVIRKGDYKLIDFFDDKRVELYHLSEDPSEENDLSATHPEKVEELMAELNAWRLEKNAKAKGRINKKKAANKGKNRKNRNNKKNKN